MFVWLGLLRYLLYCIYLEPIPQHLWSMLVLNLTIQEHGIVLHHLTFHNFLSPMFYSFQHRRHLIFIRFLLWYLMTMDYFSINVFKNSSFFFWDIKHFLKNINPIFNSLIEFLFVCVLKSLSHIWFFATPWAVAHQAPLSMGRILEWVSMPSSRGSSQPRDNLLL